MGMRRRGPAPLSFYHLIPQFAAPLVAKNHCYDTNDDTNLGNRR